MQVRAEAVGTGAGQNLTRIVLTYVVGIAMSFGVMISLMKYGW